MTQTQKSTKKIYHYCSINTLKAILHSKAIRLSDIRKSNDTKEIDFLFDSYKNWYLKKNNYTEEAYKNIANFETSSKIQLNNTIFLVSCFSEEEDDLHMWNCYGNEGVNIAFNKEELKCYFEQSIGHGINECQKKNKGINISPLDKHVFEIKNVKYYNENSIIEYFDNTYKQIFNNDFSNVLNDSPFIKNDFFKSEHEIRIVYRLFRDYNATLPTLSLINSGSKYIKDIPFKSISTDMFPHKMVIDLPINPTLIKEIKIGPNSNITENDIEQLLFIEGIKDVYISKSKG